MRDVTYIIALATLALLAACAPPTERPDNATDPQTNDRLAAIECPPGSKEAEACTLQYDPVCSDGVTYGNSCEACRIVDRYFEGACEDLGRDTPQEAPDERSFMACDEPRPEACTKEYMPVCGQKDNGIRCVTAPCPSVDSVTYGNKCVACADPEVLGYTEGACDADPQQDGFPPCAATLCEVGTVCIEGRGCVEQDEAIACDATTSCPAGLECWSLDGSTPQCVTRETVEAFCPGKSAVLESYPPQLRCESEKRPAELRICDETSPFNDPGTCVEQCPDGYDRYGSQTGPVCIMHYGREEIAAWAICSDADQCTSEERCVKAIRTTDSVEIEDQQFRCAPNDYFSFLLHTSGAEYKDESGETAVVIA